jgi:hypothetical protein
MDAPAPQGVGRDGGGRREGGTQTPDAARSGAGSPAMRGSAVPSCVVRPRKPRGGSIVRRADFGRRAGAGLLRWTSVRERKREGGRRPASAGSVGLGPRKPGGCKNTVREGRNPCPSERVGICVPGAPRNPMREPAGCGDAFPRVATLLKPPEGRDGLPPTPASGLVGPGSLARGGRAPQALTFGRGRQPSHRGTAATGRRFGAGRAVRDGAWIGSSRT